MGFLKYFIRKPKLIIDREGRAHTCFTKLQAQLFPELCKSQINAALKDLSREEQVRQRKIFRQVYGL